MTAKRLCFFYILDISTLKRKSQQLPFSITLTHPFVLLSFAIFLNDSYGFHIHARHMYVLPRGCARDENISHPDYTPVFH